MPRDPNLGPFRYALKAYLDDEKLQVPVLPAIATRLLSMYQDPDVNSIEMSNLIREDQSLVGNIVRICNSPVYAGSRQITSLQLAITRLGTRALGRIAISAIMKGKVFSADGFAEDVRRNWMISQIASNLCIQLAGHISADQEEAFLCGLLHLVGRPVILQSLHELKEEFGMDLQRSSELDLADEFHPRVGGMVARDWGLPESVFWASKHYQDSREAPEEFRNVVQLVHLANSLAMHMLDADTNLPEPAQITSSSVAEELGIAEEKIEMLLQEKDSFTKAAADIQ